MNLSKSLKVFERSLLQCSSLFTLVSQVTRNDIDNGPHSPSRLLQIVFLQAAEVSLLAPGQKAASLFTLVLYNCLSYCLSYIYSLLTNSLAWRVETVAQSSSVPHLAMTATKLTLEWTKFIVFFMTAVTVGIAMVVGVTMQGITFSSSYLLLTSLYYLSLEPGLVVQVTRVLDTRHWEWLEGEETVCSSVLVKMVSLLLSLIITTVCLVNLKYKAVLTTLVVCVYLKVCYLLYCSKDI